MALTIPLAREFEATLAKRARAANQDVPTYAAELLRRAADASERPPVAAAIPVSLYAALEKAAAARNISVEMLVTELAQATNAAGGTPARQLAALESFTAATTKWTAEHLPPSHQVDDSRESMYEGRGG